MTSTQYRTALGTVALVALAAVEVPAQLVVPAGRDTLRSLPGVEIVVEAVDADVERLGLTQAAIQSAVERRIRQGGIAVYASQQENPSEAKPYLYVHVNALRLEREGLLAVSVQVHLRQSVRSLATGSTIVNAMTWDVHNVLAVPVSELASVQGEILEYVDRFVRDWKAVH